MNTTDPARPFDQGRTMDRLIEAGMGEVAAVEAADLFGRASGRLSTVGIGSGAMALWVPGRVEVLGKHTDYGGGRSITAAVERGFAMVAVPRSDATVHLLDDRLDKEVSFVLTTGLAPEAGRWSNYPITAARRLVRNFPIEWQGTDIAICGNLPIAAGLSGSSALLTGIVLLLAARNGLEEEPGWAELSADRLALAGYLGSVENGSDYGGLSGDSGVGTFGGSEDHTAIVASQAGHLSAFGYAPVTAVGAVPLPAGHTLAVATSGVSASKTGNAMERYNQAARLLSSFLAAWNRQSGVPVATVREAVEQAEGEGARLVSVAEQAEAEGEGGMVDRIRHYLLEEGEVVPNGLAALVDGDLASFGRTAARSQEAAERLLGNQVPETSFLARTACEAGAVAASAFGAGFGGSVWALVEGSAGSGFLKEWGSRYREAHPGVAARAEFILTGAGPPAFMLD